MKRTLSEGTKIKMHMSALARLPMLEETKQQISVALKGRPRSLEAIQNAAEGRRGIFPNGGKTFSSNGYCMIRVGSDYIAEHRLIWERTHNQNLPKDWVVHHLNGVKTDNRPCNLLAMPRKSHQSELVNQALKQRIRELEVEIKILERASEGNQTLVCTSMN